MSRVWPVNAYFLLRMSWVSRQRQVWVGLEEINWSSFRINHNLCRAEAGIAYNMTTKHDHDHEDVLL